MNPWTEEGDCLPDELVHGERKHGAGGEEISKRTGQMCLTLQWQTRWVNLGSSPRGGSPHFGKKDPAGERWRRTEAVLVIPWWDGIYL